MAKRANNDKIFLTGKRRKVISSDVYTLKVPNFFTLPEYDDDDFELDSPPFEFANATWRFRCESRGKEEAEPGVWIKNFAICLLRLNSAVPQHIVFCGIILLDANDKEYDGCNHTCAFEEDYQEDVLFIFRNESPSYDIRLTLTLMINLISVERLALYPGKERLMTDKGEETVISDKGNLTFNIILFVIRNLATLQ